MPRLREATWKAFLDAPSEETFGDLYRETSALVHTICLRILRDEADARDAFQATYCRLLATARSPTRTESTEDSTRLVTREAGREADALKKRRARLRRREVAMQKLPPMAGSDPSPEEIASRKQLRERVERVVDTLPDRYRIPVALHYFHGFTHDEVALALGLTRATVSNRLARAIHKLTPRFRRSGLGQTATTLGLVLAGAELFPAPTTWSASAVFSNIASSLADSGASGAVSVTSGASAASGSVLATALALLKTKAAILVGCGIVALAAGVSVATGLLDGTEDSRSNDREEGGVATAPTMSTPESASEVAPMDGEPGASSARAALGPATRVVPPDGESTTVFGVVTIDGEPAAEATVLLLPVARTTKTAADGTFEIEEVAEPQVFIAAYRGPHVSHLRQSDVRPTEIIEGERNGPMKLPLVRGLTLSGRVTDAETDNPVAGARLSIELFEKRETITDSLGLYAFEGLPAMRLSLEIESTRHAFQRTLVQPTEDSPNVYDFALGRELALDVTVRDEAGAPVSDAKVSYFLEEAFAGWDHGGKTDADGRIRLRGLDPHASPRVLVSKESYATTKAAVPDGAHDASMAELEILLRAEESVDPELVYEGRVTSSDGLPIAEARIQWSHRSTPNRRDDETTTDAEGRYRLTVRSVPSDYRLSASAQGRAPAWDERSTPGSVSEPTIVDFVLERGERLEGSVVDAEGHPLSGILLCPKIEGGRHPYDDLEIPGQSGPMDPARTDSEGRFALEDLPAQAILLDLWGAGRSDIRRLRCEAGELVTVRMLKTGVIRGRVLDRATGDPVPSFRVKIQGGGISVRRSGPGGQSVGNPEGRFTLDDLNQGRPYTVRIEAEGYPPLENEQIPAGPPDDESEVVILLSRARRLAGRVLDAASGRGIEGATVTAAVVTDGRPLGWEALSDNRGDPYRDIETARTDEAGAFSLAEGVDLKTLFIAAPDRARDVVRPTDRGRYMEPGADGLRILLAPESRIEGWLKLRDGLPGDLRLQLSYLESPGYSLETVRADPDGRFVLASLAAGNYRLSLRVRDGNVEYPWLTRGLALEDAEVKEIRIGHDLGSCSLSGQVVDADGVPVEGARIEVTGPALRGYQTIVDFTDARGAYRIDGLGPGRCIARATRNVHKDSRYRELRTSVEAEVRADTVRNLVFEPKHKVYCRLRAGWTDDNPAVLGRVHLTRVVRPTLGARDAPERPIVSDAEPIVGGEAVFEGWFRGVYRLEVDASLGPRELAKFELAGATRIDTTEQDEDIGAVYVPAPGPITLTAVVLDSDGEPVTNASLQLRPRFPAAVTWYSSRTDDGGSLRVHGLLPGQYQAILQGPGDGTTRRGEVRRQLDVRTDSRETFRLPVERLATVRFAFPTDGTESQGHAFTHAMLTHEDWDGGGSCMEDGTLRFAVAPIEGDLATFLGRLRGSYFLTLGRNSAGSSVSGLHPLRVTIDNLEHDADLGAFEISARSGSLRVRVDRALSEERPRYVTLAMASQDGDAPPVIASLPDDQETFEIQPIPAGRYSIWLVAPGFRSDPPVADVNVEAGLGSNEAEFVLEPWGVVEGRITSGLVPDEFRAPREVRLRGPGVERVLRSATGSSASVPFWEWSRTEGRDRLAGSQFRFVGLPEGRYTLTVEVDGHPAYEEPVDVRFGAETGFHIGLPRPPDR